MTPIILNHNIKFSDEQKNLVEALYKAYGEFPEIEKDTTNTLKFGGTEISYKYAKLEDILRVVRPILYKNEIILSFAPGGLRFQNILKNSKGVGFEITTACVPVTTRLIHRSGEWLQYECEVVSEVVNAQGIGSAITYAKRYGLGAILALSLDEKDDDGEASIDRSEVHISHEKPAQERSWAKSEKSEKPAKAESKGKVDSVKFEKPIGFRKHGSYKGKENPFKNHVQDWGEVVVHYGKNEGKKLKDLKFNTVRFYYEKGFIDPMGKYAPKDQDWILEDALIKWADEVKDQKTGVHGIIDHDKINNLDPVVQSEELAKITSDPHNYPF